MTLGKENGFLCQGIFSYDFFSTNNCWHSLTWSFRSKMLHRPKRSTMGSKKWKPEVKKTRPILFCFRQSWTRNCHKDDFTKTIKCSSSKKTRKGSFFGCFIGRRLRGQRRTEQASPASAASRRGRRESRSRTHPPWPWWSPRGRESPGPDRWWSVTLGSTATKRGELKFPILNMSQSIVCSSSHQQLQIMFLYD